MSERPQVADLMDILRGGRIYRSVFNIKRHGFMISASLPGIAQPNQPIEPGPGRSMFFQHPPGGKK